MNKRKGGESGREKEGKGIRVRAGGRVEGDESWKRNTTHTHTHTHPHHTLSHTHPRIHITHFSAASTPVTPFNLSTTRAFNVPLAALSNPFFHSNTLSWKAESACIRTVCGEGEGEGCVWEGGGREGVGVRV